MPPVASPALDSAALCTPSCIGHCFVFDFLLPKCCQLTKCLYSPQLVYFNSHSLSLFLFFFLSHPPPSLLLRSYNWLLIAAFQIKVLQICVTPPPSKMNTDLSVQNTKMEEERVWDESNRVESMEHWADGGSRRNRELEGLLRMCEVVFYYCSSLFDWDKTTYWFILPLNREIVLLLLFTVCPTYFTLPM